LGDALIIGIGFILIGIVILYKRRRYISGSSLYEAEVVSYRFGGFFHKPVYTVRFKHNEKELEKESDITYLFSPEKLIGKRVFIYYNEESSKPVLKKGGTRSVALTVLFICGVLLILFSGI